MRIKLISTKFTEKGQTITTYKELLLYIKQNKRNKEEKVIKKRV